MIHEIAIDPGCLNSWHAIDFALSRCGMHLGRVLAQFPKKWPNRVLTAYDGTGQGKPKERLRITERLESAKRDGVLFRSDRTYTDQHSSWVVNAVTSHKTTPFFRILSSEKAVDCDCWFNFEDALLDDECLRVDTGTFIPQTAAILGQTLAPLIRLSRKVYIIDPYFKATDSECRKTFKALCVNLNGQDLELHVKGDFDELTDLNKRQNNEHTFQDLGPNLPPGQKVAVYRWAERHDGEEFHDRFLITDVGGVSIGRGFQPKRKEANFHLQLLNLRLWNKVQRDFGKEIDGAPKPKPAFDLIGTELTISGPAPLV